MTVTAAPPDEPPRDFAHGVWEALAATLAQPLRDALDEHLDAHGCGCARRDRCRDPRHAGGHRHPGFGYCPTAAHLFGLLPPGDQVLIG